MKFVAEHRKKRKANETLKNRVFVMQEKMKDIQEGPETFAYKQMSYKELVEEMNKDTRAIEGSDKPIMLFKD